jgi:hypothetical protein
MKNTLDLQLFDYSKNPYYEKWSSLPSCSITEEYKKVLLNVEFLIKKFEHLSL